MFEGAIDIASSLPGRDPFSAASHFIGAVLSVVATVVLVRRARRQGLQGRGVAIYGITMILTFLASSLFHYVDPGSTRLGLLKRMDHAAIFLMVAGTGTAIYASFRTSWAERLVAVVWGLALLALVTKLLFWPTRLWISAIVYLTVGWISCIGLVVLARVNGLRPLRLFLLGSVLLSIGAVVFAMEWPVLWPGVIEGHEVFHVLVLGGVLLHFLFVYQYCTLPASEQQWELPADLSLSMLWYFLFVRNRDGG